MWQGLISTGWQHSLIKFSKQQQAQDNCAHIGLLSMLMYFYTNGNYLPCECDCVDDVLAGLKKNFNMSVYTQYQISLIIQ